MRILLREAQGYVNLTEADIELLDTLPDTAIAKALKRIKTAQIIGNKTAYFMKVAQYESGKVPQNRAEFTGSQQRPIMAMTSTAVEKSLNPEKNGLLNVPIKSDNGCDVNSSIKTQLSLQTGNKTPLKREVSQPVKTSTSTNTNRYRPYSPQIYALVDPVLYAHNFIKTASEMTQTDHDSWQKMLGNRIPDAPYKLPYCEKNLSVFKRDVNGDILFSDLEMYDRT